MNCTIEYWSRDRSMTIHLERAFQNLTAREQTKLFKHMGTWLSIEDAQRCINAIVWEIRHPTPQGPRIKKAALQRFVKAMPKRIMNHCSIPTTSNNEKE